MIRSRNSAVSAFLFSFCLLAFVASAGAAVGTRVQTKYGEVEGAATSDSLVFKGIPYAAAPSGAFRWQAPREPAPWSTTFKADRFSETCPQLDLFDSKKIGGTEDCLKLNIWVSKPTDVTGDAKPKPVMVFIHGGGNTIGSGSDRLLGQDLYDGSRLAQEGVVVVTINYRLGILGFLAHRSLENKADGQVGNYAALDQIRALTFVKENIANFGGDPANVTIFGESAGAINSLILIASPLSKGLFHRAIIESGFLSDLPKDQAEKQGDVFAKAAGCADAACLRALSVDKVLSVTKSISTSALATAAGTVDGVVLKKSVLATIQAGEHNRVPVIIGTNRDEMRTLAPALIDFGVIYTDDDYQKTLEQQFGLERAKLIHERYPWYLYGSPVLAVEEAVADFAAHCPTRQLARALHASTPATYRYVFTHTSENPLLWSLGAGHGLELPYVFGSLSLANTLHERSLSRQMRQLWTSFAKDAVPTSVRTSTWAPAANDQYLDIDTFSRLKTGFRNDACDFWDQLAQ